MHASVCVCVFKQKVQGKSISKCARQHANLPEVQRSKCKPSCAITLHQNKCIYVYGMQVCVCVLKQKVQKRASVNLLVNKRTYLKFRDQV